jgi:hypothetical protein
MYSIGQIDILLIANGSHFVTVALYLLFDTDQKFRAVDPHGSQCATALHCRASRATMERKHCGHTVCASGCFVCVSVCVRASVCVYSNV